MNSTQTTADTDPGCLRSPVRMPAPGELTALPTGSLHLDRATGGYPRGRLVELFGQESSGKTSLALQAAAAIQRTGGIVAYIDADHALDPAHARTLGINPAQLLCSQPTSGEEALEICELLVRSNAVDLIVIDSAAALVPRAEVAAGVGQAGSDGQVRLLEQGLRRLSTLTARSRCCLLFLNQMRARPGEYGLFTTAGGDALKLYASLRIELRRVGCIQQAGQASGLRLQARTIKNRLAAPYARADLELDFLNGIDRCAELLDLAVRSGLIAAGRDAGGEVRESAPAYGSFRLGGQDLGRDRASALAALRANPELQRALERRLPPR